MCASASYASYGGASGTVAYSGASNSRRLLRERRAQSFTRSNARQHHQLTASGSGVSTSSSQGESSAGGGGRGGPTSSVSLRHSVGAYLFRSPTGAGRRGEGGSSATGPGSAQDSEPGTSKRNVNAANPGTKKTLPVYAYWPSQMAPGDEGLFDDEDTGSSDVDPVSRCLVRKLCTIFSRICCS